MSENKKTSVLNLVMRILVLILSIVLIGLSLFMLAPFFVDINKFIATAGIIVVITTIVFFSLLVLSGIIGIVFFIKKKWFWMWAFGGSIVFAIISFIAIPLIFGRVLGIG